MGIQNPSNKLSGDISAVKATPPPVRAGDPSERGGVNYHTKGEQSWTSEMADGFGAVVASPTATTATPGAGDMHSIAARLIISLLLILILLAVAVEAARSSGWAAPIVGR